MDSTSPVIHAPGLTQAAQAPRVSTPRQQRTDAGDHLEKDAVRLSTIGRDASRVLLTYTEAETVRQDVVENARRQLAHWQSLADAQIERIAGDMLS